MVDERVELVEEQPVLWHDLEYGQSAVPDSRYLLPKQAGGKCEARGQDREASDIYMTIRVASVRRVLLRMKGQHLQWRYLKPTQKP
jgi:hypothetical protein